MKKYIHIQKADREFISKALKVTERTIFNATHFEDINEGNDLMKKITHARFATWRHCNGKS